MLPQSKAALRREADKLIAKFLRNGGTIRRFDGRGNPIPA